MRTTDPRSPAEEERRHREHAQRREQARAGDGTLTLETEAAILSEIRHRLTVAKLRDARQDAAEQISEAAK